MTPRKPFRLCPCGLAIATSARRCDSCRRESPRTRQRHAMKTWGAQHEGVELGFYAPVNERLDALSRDLERQAASIEYRFNRPLRGEALR